MSISEVLFSFKGRIGRGTFWAVAIPFFAFNIGLSVAMELGNSMPTIIAVVAIIYCFVVIFWVAPAVYAKRWHDLDYSGWMTFTLFIPLINLLILLYLGFAPGSGESNSYGEPPAK